MPLPYGVIPSKRSASRNLKGSLKCQQYERSLDYARDDTGAKRPVTVPGSAPLAPLRLAALARDDIFFPLSPFA